jgi:hypothetical protein
MPSPRHAPFSPSLRPHKKDPKHNPRAVGACFDATHELPELLVQASVGDCDLLSSMMIYRRLSKRFAKEVRLGLEAWCKDYSATRDEMLEAWTKQGKSAFTDRYYALSLELNKKFERAFGTNDFILRKGRCLSMYTPTVYMDILQNRCSMCHKPLSVVFRGSDEPAKPSFTFSHFNCEMHREFCHTIDEVDLVEPSYEQNKLINFSQHNATEKLRAVLCTKKPFATAKDLAACTSPLTQYINGVAYGGNHSVRNQQHKLRRWIYTSRPGSTSNQLIEQRDALFHQCGIDEDAVREAIAGFVVGRDELRVEAERAKEVARKGERDAAQGRVSMLRMQFVMSRLPFHSELTMNGFSRNMTRAIGYSRFIHNNDGTPTKIVRYASYVYDVLEGFSQDTVDYFLAHKFDGIAHGCLLGPPMPNWTMRGTAWRYNVQGLRAVARLVEDFGKENFALKVRTPRKRLDDGAWDVTFGMNPAVVPLLQDTTMGTTFLVTVSWDGGESKQHLTFCDTLLYELRALTKQESKIDLVMVLDLLRGAEGSECEPVMAIERCAHEILGEALKTASRSMVLDLLGIDRAIESIIDSKRESGEFFVMEAS